jgi:NitT/TauT family transport system substrate-binding protein
MKKLVIFWVLFGFLASLMIAGNGMAADKIKLTLARMTATEILLPLDLALNKGYFDQEGITLEQKTFINGPTLMLAMANGELSVGAGVGFTPVLQAVSQGADAKIVASDLKNNAPVVAGGHIKTFKDLDGKTMGTPGLGTIQNTMLNMAAEKYGIKFKKLLHGKITDLAVFLEKGEIDGFTGWEWILADSVNRVKGAHYVLVHPVIKDAESCGTVFYGKLYRENPDVVKRFMRAWLKGVKYFNENRSEAMAFMTKEINRPQKVAEMALEAATVNKPDVDFSSVKFAVQDAINTGKIKKEVVPDIDQFINKYIDQTFLKELKKEVGLP